MSSPTDRTVPAGGTADDTADDTADVVIVGAGVSGLSTARALVELGITDVLVVDRAAIAAGGTGKSSGIVRCHYGVRSLAAMAWRALPVLAAGAELLGAETGFHNTGYLVGVGDENVAALHANVAMHRDLGIDVELVDSEAARGLWPGVDVDAMSAFAYEPQGGYGDGHLTALAFAAAARRGGARVALHSLVAKIETSGDRARGVRMADGRYVATSTVVLAAGSWSVPLAADVGIELPIRAQRAPILLVEPGRALGPVPVLSDLVSLQYVRSDGPASLLVGDSDHSHPQWADPDRYRDRATDEDLDGLVPKFSRRFPGLGDCSLSSSYAGCYDVTPDYNPIISATPIDGLWLCAGFSGHGYKISPSTGELMADLITRGESRYPDVDARDFRWERFAEGQPLVSPHPYVGAGQMR